MFPPLPFPLLLLPKDRRAPTNSFFSPTPPFPQSLFREAPLRERLRADAQKSLFPLSPPRPSPPHFVTLQTLMRLDGRRQRRRRRRYHPGTCTVPPPPPPSFVLHLERIGKVLLVLEMMGKDGFTKLRDPAIDRWHCMTKRGSSNLVLSLSIGKFGSRRRCCKTCGGFCRKLRWGLRAEGERRGLCEGVRGETYSRRRGRKGRGRPVSDVMKSNGRSLS